MLGRSFPAAFGFCLAGLLIWAAHFLVIYVFAALACARGFERVEFLGVGIVPLIVGLATAVALIGAITILFANLRVPTGRSSESKRFLDWFAAATAGLSLIAIAWNALPVLLVPVCQ